MKIPFFKYQGTGNDFVIIDGIQHNLTSIDSSNVANICNRRFGAGADGLMIISKNDDCDFEMIYYNSDGGLSTMCGNGGRCIAHLAHHLGISDNNVKFIAADGPHQAEVSNGVVALGMCDVTKVEKIAENDYVVNTGSPHYVRIAQAEDLANIVAVGKSVRYSEPYAKEGINVNLIHWDGNKLHVATYERGVEDETLSCGTGVTAAAIIAAVHFGINAPVHVQTKGGDLDVMFQYKQGMFTDVILKGPAVMVFKGQIEI